MRLAVASLLALAAASIATPAHANKCAVVNLEVPGSRIDAILGEPDQNRRIELLVNLTQYWKAHCGNVRKDADANVVRQLSRLLSLREARFQTSALLLDVSENLPAARSNLDRAYEDERRLYGEVSATYAASSVTLDALSCVREKLETGEIDREICELLLNSKEDA